MNALVASMTRAHTLLRQALCNSLNLPDDTSGEALVSKLHCITAEARERGIL